VSAILGATLPVAILAGGMGTRLYPLTERIPKALIEINGEPFLAHQLRLLRARGIERVVLCIGQHGERIREYAGDGARFGLAIDYSLDGPVLLGTAGAVRNALPLLGEEFLVVYGDSYLPCSYRDVAEAFHAAGQPGLMTVYRNEGRWDSSNVEFAEGRIVAYDKKSRTARMQHIDYGLGVFSRAAFEDGHADLAELYGELLRRDRLAAFEVHERFYEIGSFDGIGELSRHLWGGPPGLRGSSRTRSEQAGVDAGRRTGVLPHKVLIMSFAEEYIAESAEVLRRLDTAAIEKLAQLLAAARARGGRLFILGVGGSAANASHAVNDFRKICGMEAYCPTDNVSELTARTNDEGWASVFESWLRVSRLRADDCVLVFSVGGGNLEKQVSPNLVSALEYAKSVGASIGGVIGRPDGYTAQVADVCVIVPAVNAAHITPHAEAFQAVVWHLLVSHPALKAAETRWESLR
jgi:D-sedoheptulose 7-phosphate isomerase